MTGSVHIRGRDRRALLVGAGAIALLAGVRGLPIAADATTRVAAEAQAVSDRLEHTERLISDEPFLRDSLDARAHRMQSLRPLLLRQSTPARLSADLSELTALAARNAGMVVHSSSAAPDTSSGAPMQRSVVRLDGEGDISAVMQFLLLLELSSGLLRVLDLSIAQPEIGAPASKAERLRVSIAVEGVALRPSLRATERPVR